MEHQSVTNGAGSPGFVGLSRSTESVDEKSVIRPTHCSVMRLSLEGGSRFTDPPGGGETKEHSPKGPGAIKRAVLTGR